jgi:hypothetical protein
MSGETRLANIGPAEIRKRRIGGWIGIGFGAALLFVLAWADAPRAWRALVLVPLWLGLLGVFQAREKT